jgi:hypothetical protein
MPHLVMRGPIDLEPMAEKLHLEVTKWGRAVLKTNDVWSRADHGAMLIDGVVVELVRPLHPVAMVSIRDGDTVIRLWPVVEVERTPAVQRWLAVIAAGLQQLGGGAIHTTNLGPEVLEGLDLDLDLG